MRDIAWHGTRLNEPPWSDPAARVLAFTIAGIGNAEEDVHAVLNMSGETIAAELPVPPSGQPWRLAVNTAASTPDDIPDRTRQPVVTATTCRVQPRSVVVLEAPRSAP